MDFNIIYLSFVVEFWRPNSETLLSSIIMKQVNCLNMRTEKWEILVIFCDYLTTESTVK